MKPDQERVRNLLTDTVTLLCKNGLHYNKELKVQGLLGITLDENEVFVVHINEKFGDLVASSGIIVPGDDVEGASELSINAAALMRMTGSKSGRSQSDELADGEPPRKRPEPLRSRRRPSRDSVLSPKVASPGSSRSDSQPSASVSSPAGHLVAKVEGASHRDYDLAELPDIKVKQERDLDDEVIIVGGQDGPDIPGSGDDRNAMQETYSNTLSDLQSGVAQLEQIASGLDQGLPGSGLDTGVSSAKRKISMPPTGSADQLGNLGPFITGMVRNQNTDGTTTTSSASDLSQWDNSALASMSQLADESQSGAEATPGCSTWDPSQMAARQAAPGGDDSECNGKMVCCQICPRRFSTYHGLVTHTLSNHALHAGYEAGKACSRCGSTNIFTSTADEGGYMCIECGNKDLQCSVCGKKFLKMRYMREHMRLHSSNPPRYPCQQCSQVFSHRGSLKKHMDSKHKD